jgi:ATP-dependent protease ClpP protease subunit
MKKQNISNDNSNESFEEDLNFVQENKIFIYGEINSNFPERVIAPFVQLLDDLIEEEDKTIQIYISSPGGDIEYAFDFISLIELAKSSGVVIETYVTSGAASAASLIAICGSVRYISRRAYHLLHFARGDEYSHNLIMSKRNLKNFEFTQNEMLYLYEKYTNMTKKKLKKELLADNYIIHAQDLIKLKFADFLWEF